MKRTAVLCLLAVIGPWAHAESERTQSSQKQKRIKLGGDLRFRFERDWDSREADRSRRSDRDRARTRLRLTLALDVSPGLHFGFRLRTGSLKSQQSPHVTLWDFSGNPRGDFQVLPDLYFLRVSGSRHRLLAGRISFPLWRPDELFWDDDVTALGTALAYTVESWKGEIELVGTYLLAPDGGLRHNGRILALQAVPTWRGESLEVKTSLGFLFHDGRPGARFLRNGNGQRDYRIWTGNLQVRARGLGGLTSGAQFMRNGEDYDPEDPSPFTAAHYDQTNGYALYASTGRLNRKGDWQIGYTFADIGALSVHASYAQDDWVRWGNAVQTDSSDFKGHEVWGALALSPKSQVRVRLFFVGAPNSPPRQTKRFRVDLNRSF